MSSLVIIRTPFQAWLVEKVLEEEEEIIFDVLYFTQNNSSEDLYYYNKISLKARKSEYFFVSPHRFSIVSNVLFKIKSRVWYGKLDYDTLFCASIDALFVSSLVRAYPKSKLITFDDGTANINTNSCYFLENKYKRFYIYRSLMNGITLNDIKKRISKHYTLYKDYPNIIDSYRVSHLDGWVEEVSRDRNKIKTYFLGAPFEEEMNKEQIARLENYVRKLKVDAYIAHPREWKLLEIGVDPLDKKGRIAEEVIISDAQDASIVLVGSFSTVMLNIGEFCESRIVLLPKESPQTHELLKLSEESGCKVILI